jgi:hypothetical protein
MKIDDQGHPGIEHVLREFGDAAVQLDLKLRQIPEHDISRRITAIAYALWAADLEGSCKMARALDPDRRG